MGIVIDIDKAKDIAHDIRRAARAIEFKPFDEAISKQIPGAIKGAEAERQVIRDKYTAMQADIDASVTVEELKEALPNANN